LLSDEEAKVQFRALYAEKSCKTTITCREIGVERQRMLRLIEEDDELRAWMEEEFSYQTELMECHAERDATEGEGKKEKWLLATLLAKRPGSVYRTEPKKTRGRLEMTERVAPVPGES